MFRLCSSAYIWSAEFTADAGNELVASDGDAVGRMDLLTVLSHKLGHLIGLDHDASASHVMAPSLDAGVRRLPNAGDFEGLDSIPNASRLADVATADFEALIDSLARQRQTDSDDGDNPVDQALMDVLDDVSMFPWQTE